LSFYRLKADGALQLARTASGMDEENLLRQKAREAIRGGKLPSHRPVRTWGGPGSATCCAVCGETVLPDEMEYELQFAAGGDESCGARPYHVHVRCYRAWESERHSLGRAAGAPPSSPPPGPLDAYDPLRGPSESIAVTSVNRQALPGPGNDGTIAPCDRNTTSRRGSG
jgi:hypothetical protein